MPPVLSPKKREQKKIPVQSTLSTLNQCSSELSTPWAPHITGRSRAGRSQARQTCATSPRETRDPEGRRPRADGPHVLPASVRLDGRLPLAENPQMDRTRRQFLQASASAAAALSLDPTGLARAAQRPNVLLLIVDTLRADHVSAYGGRARTPNIDALASQGLRFTRFFPEAMATVPARRSILTGRRVWPFRHWHEWPGLRTTPGWAPISDQATTFTSALRHAGYWTAYVTDNPFLGYARPYRPFRQSFHKFVAFSGQLGLAAPRTAAARRRVNHWLIPVLRRMRDLYAAEVTMTDRWLGVMLARLRELGLEQNTVVALVADHGFLFGEYGWTGKISSVLQPPLTHVPFVLVDPARRRAGETSTYLGQTHDVGPTLLAMAGVRRPRGMDGVDLSPLLGGNRPPERSLAYGGYANWHYARTDRWAFVSENRGRGRRLYDLSR